MTMDIKILNFNEWVNAGISNSLHGKNVYEKRFIDTCLELNEDTQIYFELSDERKNSLDDLIVEKTLEYIKLDGKLYEGFWGSFKHWTKEVGSKAVDLSKKIIGKIGEFVKGVKEAILKVFRYTVSLGKHYAHGKADVILEKHKKNGHKPEENAKEDGKLFMEHLKFTVSGIGYDKYMTSKVDNAKASAQEELKESINMVDIINDFKDSDLFSRLDEEKEVDPDTDPKDLSKDKVEGNVFSRVIHKIVTICTSGLVQMLEHAFKQGNEKVLEMWTSMNNKLGGPQKHSLPAIATIGAFAMTTLLEIGSSLLKKFLLPGSEIIEGIYHGIHATSVMGISNLIIYSLVHSSVLYFIILGVAVVMSTYMLLVELNVFKKSDEVEKEATELYSYERISNLI